MDKQSRYTAQEMREMACHLIDICDAENECNEYRNTIGSFGLIDCESALRQAADAEDELRTMRSAWLTPETSKALFNDCVSKTSDLADIKARLAAVVKECEKMRDDFSKRMRSFTGMFAQNMRNIYVDKIEIVDDILRTARGEGSAPRQA